MNGKARIARTLVVTPLVTAMLVATASTLASAAPASTTPSASVQQKSVAAPTPPQALKNVKKAPPAPPFRGAPAIKRGMTKAQAVAHATSWRPFRVQFKYANGRKDRVVKWAFSSYWDKAPRRKWNSSRTSYLYAPGAKVIVWLGNGKTAASGGSWKSAKASMYGIGDGFVGRRTASGEVLRANSMVVAHKSMRFGTKIRFKYRGRVATAVVKDRGPYVHGRTFDLGPGTARALGFSGVGTVQYQVIGR